MRHRNTLRFTAAPLLLALIALLTIPGRSIWAQAGSLHLAQQDPYPAPGDVIATPSSYPAPETIPSPFPIGVEQGTTTTAAVDDSSADDGTESRGLLYLWLGFIATLLVFATSVIGSVMLFVRRNESS